MSGANNRTLAVPVKMEAAPEAPSERRRPDVRRYKSFVPATLRVGGCPSRAHVLNVSSAGAKLHVTVSTHSNAEVSVRVGELLIVGRVQWSHEQNIGVLFDQPIVAGAIESIVAGG